MRVEIKGENGAGDQVFEAETDQQMIVKLVTAHENATRKIRDLSLKLKDREQLLQEILARLATLADEN